MRIKVPECAGVPCACQPCRHDYLDVCDGGRYGQERGPATYYVQYMSLATRARQGTNSPLGPPVILLGARVVAVLVAPPACKTFLGEAHRPYQRRKEEKRKKKLDTKVRGPFRIFPSPW